MFVAKKTMSTKERGFFAEFFIRHPILSVIVIFVVIGLIRLAVMSD